MVKFENIKIHSNFSKDVLSHTYFYARLRLSGVAVKITSSIRPSAHVALRATDQSLMKYGTGEF